MNVRLRRLGLAGIVAVSACAPFGALPTDGGDGGSDSTIGSSNDAASADVPQELALEPAGASDAIADLPADTALDVTGPDATGKSNGTSCGGEGECASGDCVEGTCCATACGSPCFSCLNSKTGQPDGKCAPVQAGTAHASDCAASDPMTCGLDGECDGAGACRNYVAGTMCAAEACTDAASVSNYSSARTCDGHGACAAGTTSQCGSTYRCSGTKCRTACGTAQDCVSSAYCSGTTCAAKKPDGQVCSSATECANGVCGGLCCAAGCNCTQPSPANVVKNAGIDKDTTGWTVVDATLAHSSSDAQRCPYSGSLRVVPDPNAPWSTLSQCISNVPLVGDFNIGIAFNSESTGEAPDPPLCQVNFNSGFNCDADLVGQNETDAPTSTFSGWQIVSTQLMGISGANSVELTCYFAGSTTETIVYYFDMAYISKAPSVF
jgi:hypothetical protein